MPICAGLALTMPMPRRLRRSPRRIGTGALTPSFVAKALGAGISLSTLLAGLNAETEAAYALLRSTVSDEAELVRYARVLSEVQAIEIDCFIHHGITITKRESEQVQQHQAGAFNSRVMGVVQDCTHESEQLRTQAVQTSAAARGLSVTLKAASEECRESLRAIGFDAAHSALVLE